MKILYRRIIYTYMLLQYYSYIYTLNSTYNVVAYNKKLGITKENLCTNYTPFTYKYVALNEKPPIMKQNLCIFFFFIGRVECILIKESVYNTLFFAHNYGKHIAQSFEG